MSKMRIPKAVDKANGLISEIMNVKLGVTRDKFQSYDILQDYCRGTLFQSHDETFSFHVVNQESLDFEVRFSGTFKLLLGYTKFHASKRFAEDFSEKEVEAFVNKCIDSFRRSWSSYRELDDELRASNGESFDFDTYYRSS